MSENIRYNDADLAMFKTHVEQKIEKGRDYLNMIVEQINSAKESKDNDNEWMDDSSNSADLEMLFLMETRQRKHLNDLENSLIRIQNKTFGVCVVTGELIDKRRLMAVPTTSKSLEAKLGDATPAKIQKPKPTQKKDGAKVIITKEIKRSGGVAKPIDPSKPKEDWLDEDILFNDDDNDAAGEDDIVVTEEEFDFDSLAAEED